MKFLHTRRQCAVRIVRQSALAIGFLLSMHLVTALQGKTNLKLERPKHKKARESSPVDLKDRPGNIPGSSRGVDSSPELPTNGRSKSSLKLKKGSKAKYRASEVLLPPQAVKSQDPDHPNMRTYMDRASAHTMSLMPENTFWKDHDSEADRGHPNQNTLRIQAMNSSECEAEIWGKVEEEFDARRWYDANYNKTISKYGLQSFETVRSSVPKLWFEPFSSSELEECLLNEQEAPTDAETLPHLGAPFCQKCRSMLGLPRPSLNLDADPWDPRCRHCGFLNAHGPDGKILLDPETDVVGMPASDLLQRQREEDMGRHMAAVDAGDSGEEEGVRAADPRLTVEQRCDECGHATAYYRTAQVRGADEGQTAFFTCVRCKHQWAVKG